jgi:hypothetical protein
MGFQQSIRFDYGFGVPGELRKDGPTRAQPRFIVSADPTQNVVGRAFTQNAAGAGVPLGSVGAGGTGVFAGLLANPKVYASYGTVVNGPLAPSMVVPNQITGEFLLMGFVVAQLSAGTANIGDQIHFVQATGALIAVAPGTAPAAGNTLVPNTVVDELPQTSAAGLVLLRMTN